MVCTIEEEIMNTTNDAATFLHDECATVVTRRENADHIWMIAGALVKGKRRRCSFDCGKSGTKAAR